MRNMDSIVELMGSGGFIVLLTWLGKELFSGFLRRSDAKKIKELEFKQYKQQASFDLKYKVYSEIYSDIKKLQGSIEVFQNVRSFYNDFEEALFSKSNKKFFDAGNENPEQYRSIYYSDRNGRVLININHFIGLMDEVHFKLNNDTSRNEFLFSDDEALSIKAILDHGREIIEGVKETYFATYPTLGIDSESPPDKLDELMKEFMTMLDDDLNKFLIKDLDKMQVIIRDTDNLFRKEFDTH